MAIDTSCLRIFYSAIQKYGWDNFEYIILFTDLDENIAKQKIKKVED